jgi:transcriptional regulator with XRE-family HTH domain
LSAGESLRKLRESLGLTIRDVEAATAQIANRHNNPEISVSLSRLSDIETKEIVPSIFKLYGLAATYRVDLVEILKLYGVNPDNVPADSGVVNIKRTHRVSSLNAVQSVTIPTRIDPGFHLNGTAAVGRLIQQWGAVPMSHLKGFSDRAFSYGYVGLDDWTMYPLIVPGAFIQIDEQLNKVQEGIWPSEFARPIYFVETRDGFACSWCEVIGSNLLLVPHPMSPAKTRSLRSGVEAEVIGQVIGIAMRLDAWRDPSQPKSKAL